MRPERGKHWHNDMQGPCGRSGTGVMYAIPCRGFLFCPSVGLAGASQRKRGVKNEFRRKVCHSERLAFRPRGPNWCWGGPEVATSRTRPYMDTSCQRSEGQTGSYSWNVEDTCFSLGASPLPPPLSSGKWREKKEDVMCR